MNTGIRGANATSARPTCRAGANAGRYSIRINDQWRLCFEWTERGPAQVEIVDYH